MKRIFVFLALSLFFIPLIVHPSSSQPLFFQRISQVKPSLTLYYLPWCPYSQRVLDYLRGIHKTIPLKNVQNDTKAKEELREVGGKMQVPCLFIDGKALYESDSIIQWLSQHKDLLDNS